MQPFNILFIASFASSLIPSILACGRPSPCEQNKEYLDENVVPGLFMTFPDVMSYYVRDRIGDPWANVFQRFYDELDYHDAKRLHAAFKLINTVNHPNEQNDLVDMINSYPQHAASYSRLCHVVNFAVSLESGNSGSSCVQSRTRSSHYTDRFPHSESEGYHVHVYFPPNSFYKSGAAALRDELSEMGLNVYGEHDGPVGPHPQPMFEAHIDTPEEYWRVVPYLERNNNGLSILIHPIIGDFIKEHYTLAKWIGQKKTLRQTW